MKNSDFYHLYIFVLLIFFWRTALFWLGDNTMGEGKDFILYTSLVFVEILSAYLIIFANKKMIHDRWIHELCFGWEIIALVCLVINNASIGHYPKVLAWPLFFESAYLIVRWDFSMIKSLRKVFYWLIIVGAYVFYQSMHMKQFESQSNMIYFLILPVPMILLHCNSKWRFRILLLTSFLALLSMKRSMILAIILFWAIYIFKDLFSKGKKSLAIAISVILFGVAYGSIEVVDKITAGGLSSRTVNYEKDDISNGREAIYDVTLDMIANSSDIQLIFGHGHNAVRRHSPLEISAHNDFLEIIYDYGIVALLIYLGLWVYVIKQFLFHYRNNTVYFIPYTLSICIFIVMACVSQLVLYVSYFLYLVMFWGVVQASKDKWLIKE